MPEQMPMSPSLRRTFILAFTKELIKNSFPDLRPEIEIRERRILEKISRIDLEKISPATGMPSEKPSMEIVSGIGMAPARQSFKRLPKPFRMPPRLRIPVPRLPQRLQYIQPTARPGVEMDLGKINPLVMDPVIQTIECNGPNERVIIRDPGEKATKITLSKDEIDAVIKKFSDTARIPVYQGVFRVAVGKLILSAIISDVVGSKFIIKKLRYAPTPQGRGISKLQPARAFTAQPPSRLTR